MLPIFVRNYYGDFMKVKLKNDPYPSWEGMKGKTINAIPHGEVGILGEIASANAQGATDKGILCNNKEGYRFLSFSDVIIVEN